MTDDEPRRVTEDEPRRVPSTFGGLVYLIVFALEAVGLGIVAFGPWRRGVTLMGGALLLAAVMRASLRQRDAGMLRVRSRWFDVLVVTAVGLALIVLAHTIPDQL